jgi:hypothetical protein
MAQAKARKVEAKLLVVKHPIGGLNSEELAERISAATSGLTAMRADAHTKRRRPAYFLSHPVRVFRTLSWR